MDAKYVSSIGGSTISDLSLAAHDIGLNARPFFGLGIDSLRSASCPVVLHVAGGEQLQHYGHWLLFLGMSKDLALVIDSDGLRRMRLAEIASRWDGVGIYIDRKKISTWRVRFPALVTGTQYAVVLVGLLAICHGCWIGRGRLSKYFAESLLIVMAGSVGGWLFHRFTDVGLFRSTGPAAFVAVANSAAFLPKLSLSEFDRKRRTNNVALIDARFRADFERNHIPGAINLPVDATAIERDSLIMSLDPKQEVVVYCQSAGCQFDDFVASGLVRAGFKSISLFPGGWREWAAAHAKPKRQRP